MHRFNLLCPADLAVVIPEADPFELIQCELDVLADPPARLAPIDMAQLCPDATFVSRPVKSYNAYHYRS